MAIEYAVDTETTGLEVTEGDRIIEISITEITRDPNPRVFHSYFNPGDQQVNPEAFEVHGLSNEFLADKPSFAETIPAILEFLDETGDDEISLVIHNAPFDMGFIEVECEEAGTPFPKKYKIIDTLKEAIKAFPGSRHSLDALCTRFNIDRTKRTKHGAQVDTELLAAVYLAWFGQKGFELQVSDRDAQEAEKVTLGAMNTLQVPLDQAAAIANPPAESWGKFFAKPAA